MVVVACPTLMENVLVVESPSYSETVSQIV